MITDGIILIFNILLVVIIIFKIYKLYFFRDEINLVLEIVDN